MARAMAAGCADKEKAATEAIAAANARITELEAKAAGAAAGAMAHMSAEQRAALVAGEKDPALKARLAEEARKMDERDEKSAATYPIKTKPKVSAEETPSAHEASLLARIRELEEGQATPFVAAMADFRKARGMDPSAFQADADNMTADQVMAAWRLEAPIHDVVAATLQAAIAPSLAAQRANVGGTPGWHAPLMPSGPAPGMPQAAPAPPGAPPYAASAPQEFRL